MEKNLPQYNYWAEKFEMLPMYFMSFYGAQNLQDVLEVLLYTTQALTE
jgi:twinkle protein